MYYKVVEDWSGRLMSVVMLRQEEATKYIPGKWVWRKFVDGKKLGPLCVFDSLRAAEAFTTPNAKARVFECEIIPSNCLKEGMLSGVWGAIYNATGREYDHVSLNMLRWGTVLADAVRLIKEVNLDGYEVF